MTINFEHTEFAAVERDRLKKDALKRKDPTVRRPVRGIRSPSDYDSDPFVFWRYRDLVERRIISDRTDLHRKQRRGFPLAVKFSRGQGAVALFPVAAVKIWIRENLAFAQFNDYPGDPPRLMGLRREIETAAE